MIPYSHAQPRKGCKDIWNAFMAKGASFTINDIPVCPTTGMIPPKEMITWEEAKAIYKKQFHMNENFLYDAFVCFHIDDYKFDGPKGIWSNPKNTLNVLKHFSGVITPDFSTYQDFPIPLKYYATYRMRLIGYWWGCSGLSVVNNVRWGTPETYWYCFDGIPKDSIVAIGTIGGSPRRHIDRDRFESGLYKMVEVLRPHTIIVYGSANYPCFDIIKSKGVVVLSFDSKTAKSFKGGTIDE